MSQLERALRKARAEGPGVAPALDDAIHSSRLPTTAFVSPWPCDQIEMPLEPLEQVVSTPAATRSARAPVRSDSSHFTGFNLAVIDKLAVGERAQPVVREQFRKIVATLCRLRETRPVRVVMVVSAVPGEGKTLTSTNLALTLSESYQSRVLLVDADLRRPTIHQLFDIPNKVGLKEALTAASGPHLATVSITGNLEVLTAGNARLDPIAALTSERLREMLAQAAGHFEWVVLDTPPVELLPDARILAALADAAILVVEAGSTKCQPAQKAVEAIGRDRVVGVVLNQMTNLGERAYGYYGHDREDSAR